MYDIPVSYVNPYMACITYDISRLGIGIGYLRSYIAQFPRCTRNRIAFILEYAPYKPGAIRTVCQTRSACYIRIANKLTGIRSNRLPGCTSAGSYIGASSG